MRDGILSGPERPFRILEAENSVVELRGKEMNSQDRCALYFHVSQRARYRPRQILAFSTLYFFVRKTHRENHCLNKKVLIIIIKKGFFLEQKF
jgi:hypothetical protein